MRLLVATMLDFDAYTSSSEEADARADAGKPGVVRCVKPCAG